MKSATTVALILTLFVASLAPAQADAMKGMDAKDMKMNGMDMSVGKDVRSPTYTTMAVVKAVDTATGKLMLAHEAINSLNWPAMTMGFTVKDKTLLEGLAVGRKVSVEFRKDGTDYVVVSVK